MAARKTQQHQAAAQDAILTRGLPSDEAAERACLGAVLVNEANWEKLTAILTADDWSLEAHRRIWGCMRVLFERGEKVNHITLVGELTDVGQLESVGGMGAVVSLDEGLPEIVSVESFARRVKEKASLRSLIYSAQRQIDWVYSGSATAQEIAEQTVEKLNPVLAGTEQDDGGRGAEQIALEFPGGLSAFLDPSQRPAGLKTGFRVLDEATNGLHPGEMTILGARPSVGKTALALNIADYVARRQHRAVAFFSLEMSGSSLLTRLMCSTARVDQHRFRCGFLRPDERGVIQKALHELTESPLTIFDIAGVRIADIAKRIRKLKREQNLGLAIIDYLGLIATERAENRNLAVGAMTRELKLLARECEIPLLVLSQLSRPDKTARFSPPTLSDLRDSGNIEQDADNVWFLWREELVRTDREDLKGLADLIISKQRNGPILKCPLRFLGGMGRFENRAEDTAFPENEQAHDEPPQSSFHEPQGDGW